MEGKPLIVLVGAQTTSGRLCLVHTAFVQPIRYRQTEFLHPVASLKAALTENWQELRRLARLTGRELQ